MEKANRLPLALFLLRLGVFLLMFMWTVDKFVRPLHAAGIFGHFYHIRGLGPLFLQVIAGLELALVLGFLAGYQKRFTYGAVLLFHTVSTLSSFHQFLSPFQDTDLLFFASWPALAACFALYYLRDLDTMWTVEKA